MLYINLIHISCFMFFADDLLLAVCSICNLDYRNDVRQKANLSDFLNSSSKWAVKQWRQLTNIQRTWPWNC